MTSTLGLLEARETAARERVENLRDEAACAAAALEVAEIEWDRQVIGAKSSSTPWPHLPKRLPS